LPAQQSSRPPGKPFMDGNNRAAVLLYLLFSKCKIGDKRYVKIFLIINLNPPFLISGETG
jgi:hypothetical protein